MGVRDAWKALFQGTQESKPQRGEYGFTGTKIFAGLPFDEYNPDLAFPKSSTVYDQMRRSDGQVAAVLAAVTLPIRSTKWMVQKAEDAQDEQQAQSIADFVEDNLFGGMKFSWDDHLREALLMFVFGFSVFEKVYQFRQWKGKPVIWLDKYAPRVAKSIWRFPQNENYDIIGVEQINFMTGQMATIPLDKCRVYTFQREGDNISGISLLRPAYKHWYYKDALYKIMAVGIEKTMIGTPYAKLPQNISEEERQQILNILTSIRTSEDSGFTVPNSIELDVLEGKQTPVSAMPFIEHHDVMIARTALAQFLNLGQNGSGGAYSLGQSMTDLFVMSLEATANYIQGEVQKDIEQLVKWNFGDNAPIPELTHKNISFHDTTQLANALSALGAGHIVMPDEELENYIREMFGIPPIDRKALLNQVNLPPNRYIPEIVPDTYVVQPTPGSATNKGTAANPAQSVPAHEHAHEHVMLNDSVIPGVTGGEQPEPKGTKIWRRDLTPHEKNMALGDINDGWTTQEAAMIGAMKEIQGQATDQIVNKIRSILALNTSESAAISQINAIQPPLIGKYQNAVKSALVDSYRFGIKHVARELGMKESEITDTMKNISALNAKAETIAQLHMTKLTSAIKLSAVSDINKGLNSKGTLFNAKKAAYFYTNGPDLKLTGSISISESINAGRSAAAEKVDGVQGAMYSAILDERTCPLCESLDEKYIHVDNPDFDIFRPPLHANCRCILTYIGKDEKGIEWNWETPPGNLVKRYGSLVR